MGGRGAAGGSRTEATRRRILDAAEEEWARLDNVASSRGEWPTVAMSALAKRAGVAQSTVYEHFHSQGVLAASVLRRLAGPGVFDWADNAATAMSGIDAVGELVRRTADLFVRNRALASTVLAAAASYTFRHGPPADDAEDPRRVFDLPTVLADHLQRAVTEGDVRDDVDPRDAAASIFNLLLLRVMSRPHEDAGSTADHVLGLTLHGLVPR